MTVRFHSNSVPLGNDLPQNSQKAITEADVLITAALAQRPARQPDLAAENQALHTLARQLTDDPQSMLKTLVRIARDLCRCDTAGVSLLETLADGTQVFRWVAIAGALEFLEQTTTPANFSPCGTTIQRGQPQLYAHPELYFTYLHHPEFPIVEGLLLPIGANNKQLGTIWIISHNEHRQFDREDVRLMTSLAGFTAAALQSIQLRQRAEEALQREQTARLETEATHQALDESAKRAVDILESITDAFISLDREWRVTYLNQAVVRINNLQREEIIGKTHWEMWPWSVGTIVEQTYRQVVADRVAAHFEVLYEPLKMWLEIHAYPSAAGINIYFRDISDRKQADAALRQSEERYRTLFESIDEGFCVIQVLFDENDTPSDYRFLEVNPAFEQQTGLQAAAGKTVSQLVPNLESHWVETYGKIALTGESLRFESGSEVMNRWFDVYAFRIGQPDERKIAILFKDISDRKRIEALREQAEKALMASEEQIRNILESITDGFFALDRDWRFTYVNPQAERLLDRTPGDLLGKVIWEVYPGTVGMEFERVYRHVASQQVASSFTSFYPDHNRWYEAHAYPAAEGITVYFKNVTDRKQSEQALMESEANARTKAEEVAALMEITPAAIWIAHDPQCHQMTANQTAYKLMRTEPGSVTTSTPADGSYPLPFKQQKNGQEILPQDLPMQKAIRINQEVTDELEFIFDDGTVQVIYGKAVPLYDSAGIIRGAIAAFVDITALKQIEREREQILEREQTAREAAENANRIKDEFLAVLSHELRSPLNPILGWSRLLQKGKLDEARTAQALATIERNAKLQSKLIEDLLDVSRILQGKLRLTVSPVNLASTIRAAIETVQLAAEAKSVEVEVDLDPNVRSVWGDATRLQQVVWNLLSNAVKFTEAGGRVEVRLAQVDNGAQITVRDNGKGIPSEFLPYIFDYFRQADSATTRQFGGLGLGLAIVRHLVELHGGTVEADSPGEGLGATFTARLPLMPISPAANQAEQSSQTALNLQGVRVLVVDDDTDTREFVVFLLQQAEASVISATSAGEGFAALTQSQPDVLLSDIGMPDMDGYMLMRQVRALPPEQGGQVPAIALTAYAGDFNEKQAMAAGFQSHIAKPVEPNELVTAIATLLRRQSRSEESTGDCH